MKTFNLFIILFTTFLFTKSYATIRNVPGEYRTIQAGIDSSVTGDTVLVQPGTYPEHINIGKNVVLGSLFLTTGDTSYISSTIIDPTPVSGVVIWFGAGRDSTCVLTGFTITGGTSNGFGAGIRCVSTSPTISHNIIRDNIVDGSSGCWGGGIFLELNSSPKIIYNQILNNTATYSTTGGWGGGIHSRDSNPYIANNIISGNSARINGGGIYFLNSQVLLYNNTISANNSQYGGGIYCDGNSSGIIGGNAIYSDSAGYGGGIYLNSNTDVDVIKNIVHSNYATSNPAGLHNGSSLSTIDNNTFCFNQSPTIPALHSLGTDTVYNNIFYENIGTGAVFTGHLKNCDFWGNTGGDFLVTPPAGTGVISTVNINGDSCDVFGNIFLDPFFADTANFDFNLTWANWPAPDSTKSPCIDAGDPNYPLDPDNTISDIGALYFNQPGNNIPGGYVSGTWTAANSPYLIRGDVTIHADSTLSIDPGVEVIFQGHYRFIINGTLNAIGTETDSIRFTAAIPDTGWRGLRFMNAADTCHLQYCIIEYGKATAGITFHERRGGGIYSYQSYLDISHCSIRNNYAEIWGGGIGYLPPQSHYTFLISDCDIVNNTTDENGGGIYSGTLSGYTLDIQNCLISNNTASYDGGGIFMASISGRPTLSLTHCTVEYNQAGTSGGGIEFSSITLQDLNIVDTDIRYNTAAVEGGGIHVDAIGSYSNISNSTFIGNQVTGAAGKGGAIYGTLNYNPLGYSITHTTFADNHAFEGGALFLTTQTLIFYSTFVNNSANSGSAIFDSSSYYGFRLTNSILYSNSPAAIHNVGNVYNLKYSDFHSNGTNATGNVPAGFGQLSGINANGDSCDAWYNIFLDPLLADTGSGDYHLTWTNWPTPDSTKSPCIDAGDPSEPFDPDGTRPDIGAFYFNQLRPLIFASDSLLDFGIVDIGQSLDLGLTLHNGGTDSLCLHSMLNQHSEFIHNWNPADSLILPGDSLIITITFTPLDTNMIVDTLFIDNNDKPIQVRLSGKGKIVVGIEDPSDLPKVYTLYPAYPNPFNPITHIAFDIPSVGRVTLTIYDILGRNVSTLVNRQMTPGRYEVTWDAGNLPSGLYFYRFEAGEFTDLKKMILMK